LQSAAVVHVVGWQKVLSQRSPLGQSVSVVQSGAMKQTPKSAHTVPAGQPLIEPGGAQIWSA
jgi:hypothetical protein